MSETEFVRIGSINRKNGIFTPKLAYRDRFEGINIVVPTGKVLDYLDGKLNWLIIGSLPDEPKGQNGIFLNLAKSNKSLVFYIDNVAYIIPKKAYLDFDSKYIGVFIIE